MYVVCVVQLFVYCMCVVVHVCGVVSVVHVCMLCVCVRGNSVCVLCVCGMMCVYLCMYEKVWCECFCVCDMIYKWSVVCVLCVGWCVCVVHVFLCERVWYVWCDVYVMWCVFMYMCAHVSVCTHIWRPEVDAGNHHPSPFHLIHQSWSLSQTQSLLVWLVLLASTVWGASASVVPCWEDYQALWH